MNTLDIIELLQSAGGYGVAGFMYYLYTQERAERFRYRDQFEEVLRDLPNLTRSLEDLTNEVTKLAGAPAGDGGSVDRS